MNSPSAHLTDLTGFVSRGGSSPPLCAGGGCVRSSPASSAALSSSSSSPTPNNSSRSSQTFPSAKPPERARPLPFFVLFCGNFVAEGAVSGLLCRGSNCVPSISSSVSESRLREGLDPESRRYNLEICRGGPIGDVNLYTRESVNIPRVSDDSTVRDNRQRPRIGRSYTRERNTP